MKKYNGVFEYFESEQFSTASVDSQIVLNTYWIKTGTEFMRARKNNVWQYHVNKEFAEKISAELPGTTVQFMEYSYIPKNPK